MRAGSTALILTASIQELAAQTCPPNPTVDPTTGIIEGPVSPDDDESRNAAVSLDGLGRFVIAYETKQTLPNINDIFVVGFDAVGDCIHAPAAVSDPNFNDKHFRPSIAMSQDGHVLVGWLASRFGVGFVPKTAITQQFDFDLFNPVMTRPPASSFATGDSDTSVGIADTQTDLAALAWSSHSLTNDPDVGLLYLVSGQFINH